MEGYTLTRDFKRENVIDSFESFIWTERYYGDSEFQIVAPATSTNIAMLSEGTFIELDGAAEIMMLETRAIDKDGKITATGISLLKWMNSRPIRQSIDHKDQYWNLEGFTAGQTLWKVLNDTNISVPFGVLTPANWQIPNVVLDSEDASGPTITVAVPYGPLYDALYQIATAYKVGMTLYLERQGSAWYLKFRSYVGTDRSSEQTAVPSVQFSRAMDSLTDVNELRSLSAYATDVYAYVPSNPGGLASVPGVATVGSAGMNPFDIRVLMIFADDITTDLVGGDAGVMQNLLNQRAASALASHPYLVAVDGEVVPTTQFVYGRDYNLGDIVEFVGYTGALQKAWITEYIRSHDEAGEKAYPTFTAIS
jgi:hypothetical protein